MRPFLFMARIFEIEILHVYVLPDSSPIVFEDARYLGDAFSLPKEKVSDIYYGFLPYVSNFLPPCFMGIKQG